MERFERIGRGRGFTGVPPIRYPTGMSPDVPSAAAPPVFLDAVLIPHRSLPPHGFRVLMVVFGGVSFAIGTLFWLLGAWPVIGFFGLDVVLVYGAFRLSYRSARRREIVRLLDDRLTVESIDVRGRRRQWQFQPYWLRVIFEEKSEEENRLILTSHGRSLIVGSFLAPTERRKFADRLKAALVRWRAHWMA
jgi:uncharacterized membrane protein